MEGSRVNKGITRRAFSELFASISERSGASTYQLSVSIVEIYNDQIRDLLSKKGSNRVEIRDSRGELSYSNLSKHKVKNYQKIERLLAEASEI